MSEPKDTNRVELSPSGKKFHAIPDSSLLESGLSSGVALPYSCANGSCGDCRARVLSGVVRKINFHDYALTEAEKLAGVCLLCANTADSDLLIEVSEATSAQDIPLQTLRGKVCHVENLNDIAIVRFKLVRGKALRYLPGQYATLIASNGDRISLPVANCPCEPDYLEFHIPLTRPATQIKADGHKGLMENSATEKLSFAELGPRERITVEGPHGEFTINKQLAAIGQPTQNSIYFIATATGFSAIKPLLEHVMSQECDTRCTLVWIASDSVSHYQHNLCRSWADAFDNIFYHPLGSIDDFSVSAVSDWGLQQSGATIYISGALELNRKVKEVLTMAGVADTAIQIDATVQHGKLATARVIPGV